MLATVILFLWAAAGSIGMPQGDGSCGGTIGVSRKWLGACWLRPGIWRRVRDGLHCVVTRVQATM